jgi:hypothetical protein
MSLIVLLTVAALCALCANAYEIAPITPDMQSAADAIVDSLLPASGVTTSSSEAWTRLAYICDTFGPRFSGSQALETAVGRCHDPALTSFIF